MLLTLSGYFLKSGLSQVKVDFGRILTSHSISCRCFMISLTCHISVSVHAEEIQSFKAFQKPGGQTGIGVQFGKMRLELPRLLTMSISIW